METTSLDMEASGKVTFPRFNLGLKKKFACLLFLMGLYHLNAGPSDSVETKLYLDFTGAPLIEVIHKIESETEFKFFYSKKELDLNHKVNIKVNGLNIKETLKILFLNEKIDFKIIKEQILLRPKTTSALTPNGVGLENQKEDEQITVSGTITDVNGAPLPGTSILVKNTTIGVTSDFDGNYSIEVPEQNAVLVFSYIGFVTKEVPVDGRSTINVVLEENAQALGEVVVRR